MRGAHWRIYIGLTGLLLTLVAGAVQVNSPIDFWGIKPNLILIVLIVFGFFTENFIFFLILTLLGSIGIKFMPGLGLDAVAIAVVALCAFIVKSRAVSGGLLGVTILLALGTFGTYLIVSPGFFYNHFLVVLIEAVYNVVLGAILFELLQWVTNRRLAEL